MVKIFFGILMVVAIATQGYAQLRCFTCVDCPDPFNRSEDLLQLCPAGTTTTTTTTTVAPDTTTGPTTVPTIPTTDATTEVPITPPPITTPDLTSPTVPTTTIPTSPLPEGIPTTTTVGPTMADLHNRQENIRMQCFRVEAIVNEQTVISRGCVQAQADDATTCALANAGATPAHCNLCDHEGCNTATRLAVSFVGILSVILMAVRN